MKDEYSQIIVKRILELCRQRDFTIYQLSAMSGISYSTLDNLINHKTFNPKIKTHLHSVLRYLNFLTIQNWKNFHLKIRIVIK